MKPGKKRDPERDESAQAGSSVRTRQVRLNPRLEEIAEAARRGELSEDEAIEQIIASSSDWVARFASPEAALAAKSGLRALLRDPEVLAAMKDDED